MSNDGGRQSSDLQAALASELTVVVARLSDDEKEQEQQVRPVLVEALERCAVSRYEFGAALAKYKSVFKKEGTWVSACKAIGRAISRSGRTVMRILEDYERANKAPSAAREALAAEGYDPAAAKNSPLLEQVEVLPWDEMEKEARREAVRNAAANLKQNNHRFGSREQRHIWSLRIAIRKRLGDIPSSEKKQLLQQAIAEEAFDVWRIEEPFTLEICPRKGAPMDADLNSIRKAS